MKNKRFDQEKERVFGKKKYLVRRIEEEEAEEQIKEYEPEEEDYIDNDKAVQNNLR